VAERWNRTMNEKMFKYFTANNTNKYIDVLDDFVERYNNMRHSSIKMTPVEASKKENEVRVCRYLYQEFERRLIHANSRLVRESEFSRRKDSLRKGSLQTGQKKCSSLQKFKEPTQLLVKQLTAMVKKFKGLSTSKSFRRHHKKFTELRKL